MILSLGPMSVIAIVISSPDLLAWSYRLEAPNHLFFDYKL
jgi:hypothetical protein